MNSAIHLPTLPFIARPSQRLTPNNWTLQRAHMSHITNNLTELLISFAINALRRLLSFFRLFSIVVSFVFSHIQPLFCKMGVGGYPGVDRYRPHTFADAAAAGYYFFRFAELESDVSVARVEKENRECLCRSLSLRQNLKSTKSDSRTTTN